ncbi:ubiquitin carboxyl-hydrolase [Streptococcus sp. Marseille-P7376]|uniref:ubiquitin carboxyl-hydrolase n=1 Tax=Streptococcus sp. Marseille-P7376 TaxID=2592044 RepID=UPI0011E66D54|nr:ubiquitin carboxyl-hydrolase [Streptococcus sp. Marseille-P7376]
MKVYKSLLIFLIGFLYLGTITAYSRSKTVEKKYDFTLTAEDKKKLRTEEEQIALYLVNHYQDVKKIEFVNFHKGGFGTGDSISVKVNSNNYIKPITLGDPSGAYIISYNPEEFHLNEKNVPTQLNNLKNIKIKYYEEIEE